MARDELTEEEIREDERLRVSMEVNSLHTLRRVDQCLRDGGRAEDVMNLIRSVLLDEL